MSLKQSNKSLAGSTEIQKQSQKKKNGHFPDVKDSWENSRPLHYSSSSPQNSHTRLTKSQFVNLGWGGKESKE